jgi:hypothetical protein
MTRGKAMASKASKVLLNIPRPILDRVDADAASLGLSRSDWVRRACTAYLDASRTPAPMAGKIREAKAKAPVSATATREPTDEELWARLEALKKELFGTND